MIHFTIEFDWTGIDPKWNYVAYDGMGYLYGYLEEPKLCADGTWPKGPSIGVLPAWVSTEGWHRSLRKRPAPPQRWILVNGVDGSTTIWDNKQDVALYGAYVDSIASLQAVVDVLNNYEEKSDD
jgi:hypothetical protein